LSADEPSRTIFITGAASGIGLATARLFAAQGWCVGGFDVDQAGLARLREEIEPGGGITGVLDVTDKAAFDAAIARFGDTTGGRLDVFHNNAGIGESGWFEDVPYEKALRLIHINYIGVVNGVYAALPLLRQTPGSLCFNTASSSAIFGVPRLAVYSSTKFAVKGLTEALSIEFERHGVRVMDALPGLIDTPLLDVTPNHSGSADEAILAREHIATEGPLRLISPDEVARCVWNAYHDETGRVHWYVPEELEQLEEAKLQAPAGVRAMLRGDG
jgi:NAD(P)-dependent dehydrogenase (short-subunit alcohol dehydrogenase family)